MEELAERIARYAATRLEQASDVCVEDLQRIHGGASRETYRLRLCWDEGGEQLERRLILRRDPPGSLIDTERENEFNALRAFHGTPVPVPEVLWLERDTSWLDYEFFVMQEIAGFESSPQLIQQPPYAQHAERYGERMWTILGEIAKADPKERGLLDKMDVPAPESCWSRELDYWENEIDQDALFPQPIARAAIRWMRRNPPPPPARLSLVHGDYRTGNYLYDKEGEIRAILDWEMAHLGDPLEDLAWSINQVWSWGAPDKVGGLIPRARALEIWQRTSGIEIDPDALHWWEVFNSVKGLGIWVSSNKEFLTGANRDPVLALSGWLLVNAQDRALLQTMGYLKP